MVEDKDLTLIEFCDKIGWKRKEKRYYELVDSVCECYGLDLDVFKMSDESQRDYIKEDHKFRFKKEWNDLAAVLFSMYDKNPYNKKANSNENSASIDQIIKYYEDCIQLVETKLPDFHRKYIQLHNVYQATLMEITHLGMVQEKLQLLFSVLGKIPVELRSILWIELIKTIDNLTVEAYHTLFVEKEKLELNKGPYNKQLYGDLKHNSIDYLVAEMLDNEMSQDHLDDRQNLIDNYNKARKQLDDYFEEQDPPEVRNAVNKFAEENNIDEIILNTRKMLEEKEIARIKKHATKVMTPNIDEIVELKLQKERELNLFGKKSNADKWRIAGEQVKVAIEENKENKATAEIVLRNVNYSINKRVKLKREEKRKRK